MLKKFSLLSLFSLVFFSCTDSENQPLLEEKKTIELNVLSNSFQTGVRSFVFFNNSTGENIGYQEVQNGQNYSIEIPDLDRTSMTILSILESSQGQNFVVRSYHNISTDFEITLGLRPSGYQLPEKGAPIQIQVLFSEFGGWASLSHASGEMTNRLVTQQFLDGNQVNLRFSPVVNEDQYLLIAENAQGEKRSGLISLDQNSNGFQVNFEDLDLVESEMIPYSEVLDPNFQIVDYSIYEAVPVNESWFRNGYLLDSKNLNPFAQEEESLLFIPQNDGLLKADFTYFNPSQPSIIYTYAGIGESIDFPLPIKGDFPINDRKFDSFSFSKLPGANDWKITFSKPATSSQPPYQAISVEIYGNGENVSIEFPEELLSLYPFLEELKTLEASTIEQNFRTGNYDDFVRDQIVELPQLKTGFVLQVKKSL